MSGRSWTFDFFLWFGLYLRLGPFGLLVGVLTYVHVVSAYYKVISVRHIALLCCLGAVEPITCFEAS